MKPKASAAPQPKRYYLQAEAMESARTIAKKRGAQLTDRELGLILAVAMVRSPDRSREKIGEDFESARGVLCSPELREECRSPGEPMNKLEWWFKIFLRERDAVLEIMLKAADLDRKNSLDSVTRELRNEAPGTKSLGEILDQHRKNNPRERPDEDRVSTRRKRLRRESLKIEGK